MNAQPSQLPPPSRHYAAFDNLIEGCQVISPEWRYLYVNEAVVRQGKMPKEELLGRTMPECYPGIENTPFFQLLRKVMAARVPGQMENEFTFPDGTKGVFELRFQPVPEGVLILSLDSTERHNIEAQLRQSQRLEAVGSLAGGVAHDFNNLLTAILLHGNRLLKLLPEGSARQAAAQIVRAGERGAALTGQLLAFSRQQVLEPRVIDLNEVVASVGAMLHRLIGENIELTTSLEPSLWRVKADPGRIEQVILNLAVNARDAMPRGGSLSIETRNVRLDANYARTHVEVSPGPHVMLAVSDTGEGMGKDVQARIFEPFFTTKEPGKGTGLGLAMVFGIVKQSGGSIWVYSEPGRGSTFKIYLPRVLEDVSPAEAEAVPGAPTGDETLLLVEDDETVREITADTLRELGYRVLVAENGPAALALCRAHDGPLHLLVSDVIMPGMDGPKVAEEARSIRPGLKALFLSGYTDDAMPRHGIGEDVDFLQKPFTLEALALKVREALARP